MSYRVALHTRSKLASTVCAYCNHADAGYCVGAHTHVKLHCSNCKRIQCVACNKSLWVRNAGCCVWCVRKAAGLSETDGSKDDSLKSQLPCPHLNQATYSGCTVWRCHDCGAGGTYG